MIKELFGNRNIERILFFIFVNEKCYGSQLQNLLQIPLTPIQKALIHLEKNEILHSYFEGKVRIYEFNPSYPLRWELESLLKKAYTLLPAQEKRKYCFIHKQKLKAQEEGKRHHSRKKALCAFWERLLKIQKLSLIAKSRQGKEKLIKTGKAKIELDLPAPLILTFQEKGYWLVDQLPKTSFKNIFRWSLDLNASLLTLEHLRYGSHHPVFLFHLTPIQSNKLISVDAHLCKEDTYLGSIEWDAEQIIFIWRVIGPQKNDELIYHYS